MKRPNWPLLAFLGFALLAAVLIATQTSLPGINRVFHPRVECQDSPACREFIAQQIEQALKHQRGTTQGKPRENTGFSAGGGGRSAGNPPGSPPGGGHHTAPPSPPPKPPPGPGPGPGPRPGPGPSPRPDVSVCIEHPQLQRCIDADLPELLPGG